MRRFTVVVIGLLLGAVALPAQARVVECEGRCDDGNGNIMLVTNRCDETSERCRAGCDTSGPRVHPYAECVKRTAPGAEAAPGGSPGGASAGDTSH